MSYTFKLIQSGNYVDTIRYSRPVKVGRVRDSASKSIRVRDSAIPASRLSLSASISRSRNNLRRLVNSNPDLVRFVTLTFREHITDYKVANYKLNQFFKRLRYIYPDLKYIAIPELTKRGRIHYHFLTNVFIPHAQLAKVWRAGFVQINRIHKVGRVGAYVSKYLSKQFSERFVKSKKRYFCSKNLSRPFVVLGHDAQQYFQDLKNTLTQLSISAVNTRYLGVVRFTNYVYRN